MIVRKSGNKYSTARKSFSNEAFKGSDTFKQIVWSQKFFFLNTSETYIIDSQKFKAELVETELSSS